MNSVTVIASVSVSMLVVMAWLAFSVEGQFSRADRFRHNGSIRSESGSGRDRPRFTEAPAGFEMGITTPLLPVENTSLGRFVGYGTRFDAVAEPEDDGVDVIAFANFMRSTKAPSRGEINHTVNSGEQLFTQIGCATCHVSSITTAAPGTQINGGGFTIPPALGNKIIHPYSDFLLHDIGTSDGIPILPTPEFVMTANLMRTAPLWALRTRNRLMHDGLSFTAREAIERHAGQASAVVERYNALSEAQKRLLLAFLNSV